MRERRPTAAARGAVAAALAGLAALAATVLTGPEMAAVAAVGTDCPGTHWVASWAGSPTDSLVPVDATGARSPSALTDQTARMVVTPHLGGSSLRIHLSNRFSSSPVTFGRVTVGVQTSGAAAAGIVPVTFGTAPSVTVPAGQDVTSDPVALTFSAFTPIAVSSYVPGVVNGPTKHWNANATSYYSAARSGDLSAQSGGAGFTATTGAWLFVNGVDVMAPADVRSVVAFGDSITDGFVGAAALTVPADASVADTNGRYPDVLQRRLNDAGLGLSVVNAGISGNQLLTDGRPFHAGPSGLARFGIDALAQAGVDGVLLLEGTNDLGMSSSTPEQIIAGFLQLIERTHAAGAKIWLGTLLPASDALVDGTALAPNSEDYRQRVNSWIRGQTRADGVVDFDAALRDPANPTVLRAEYASVDNLHPSPAGYRAMANAVDLALLDTTTTGGCRQ
ncbi:GDSL-type esterase/lipase family protein [Parafrankia sp. EUN1f]|uniref:GDSL-type esterase/lipase family protein n=1 Tax=Parafrankia sp. EUN1f TaxID=102897 RepID=UPI0001C4430C|nr:GDSL-type esterase/lipase family protein [Parafrankia sp. EUN1f]EFC84168.1 lipolytic protein G-D-S-L family [Parafrankia sp. EUN1f]